jgi:hypothetical protein
MDLASPPPPSASIPCAQCGYSLRGLPADGPCPECAEPIARSRELIGTWLARGVVVPLVASLRHLRVTLLWAGLAYFFGGMFLGMLPIAAMLWGGAGGGLPGPAIPWTSIGKAGLLLISTTLLAWHARSALSLLETLPARDDDARARVAVRAGVLLMVVVASILTLLQIVSCIPGLNVMNKETSLWVRRCTSLAFVLGFSLDAMGTQSLLRPLALSLDMQKLADDLKTGTKWSLSVLACVAAMAALYALGLRKNGLGGFLAMWLFIGPLVTSIQLLTRSRQLQLRLEALLRPQSLESLLQPAHAHAHAKETR